MEGHACCTPGREPGAEAGAAFAFAVPRRERGEVVRGMAAVPGGAYLLGGDDADGNAGDGEGPVREVELSPFRIDPVAVTTAKFAAFAKATGHVTTAEREGWSYVFHMLLDPRDGGAVLDAHVPGTPWWLPVQGADWRHPCGPSSDASRVQNHPVTHVSWHDARAYAAWAGKSLPTEAQWEAAARGGLVRARYPWGDELTPRGRHRANIWQGAFPERNTREDGHVGTAPVKSYAPNGFGLYQMSGNVWEWCADRWSTTWHAEESPATRRDPRGPGGADGADGSHGAEGDARVVRGGSYLCHDSYCNRYRVAARTRNTPDSSSGNTGFRCVVDDAA